MDHKVSKDMISSGMIPSGEKTQADLGRTQYGSAPSPSKLMDAYKSMYGNKEEVINEHHKKDADGNTIPHEDEEVNEGKLPAGLQAYLDKKKGKKEDKKDMKEKYDLVYEHFIGEGFSEEETYERMSNLTEEQLDEFIKALSKNLATRAAQYGANLGKSPETKVDFIGGIKRKPFQSAPQRKPFDAVKPGDVGFKAKSASDVVMSAAAMNRKKQTVSNQTEQVDTYDIVLDHFLNEGYEKEDIIKAMSTVNLTEEPITATLAAIGGVLAKGAAVAAKGAAIAGKVGMAAGKAGMAAGKAGLGVAKGAMKGVVSAAKPVTQGITKSATGVSKSASAVKDLAGKGLTSAKDIAGKGLSNVGQQVKKVVSSKPPANKISPTSPSASGEDRLKRLKDFAKREIGQEAKRKILQGGQQPAGTNKTGMASAKTTDIAASADLFDIVKGQLLDEGMSEEEIKDIMLTLTPDEIMEELSDTVKRNDALNRERAIKAAQERKVPQDIRDKAKKQYKAGTPRENPNDPYTKQDAKDIRDYYSKNN